MSRPSVSRLDSLIPNTERGFLVFGLVTSGNPTVVTGRSIKSVVRSATGRYKVTLQYKCGTLVVIGPNVVATDANKNFNVHVDSVNPAATDGADFTLVVLDAATEGDLGAGGRLVQCEFITHQGGDDLSVTNP